MKLQLVTLLGVKVDQEIYGITLPTEAGEISVYQGHEPLVTLVKSGVLSVRHKKDDDDNEQEYFATSGGVAEINAERVRVLVDEADHGDDILEAESKAALERAMKLREKAGSQMELEEASKLIDRHAVRLKVAGLRRRHRN